MDNSFVDIQEEIGIPEDLAESILNLQMQESQKSIAQNNKILALLNDSIFSVKDFLTLIKNIKKITKNATILGEAHLIYDAINKHNLYIDYLGVAQECVNLGKNKLFKKDKFVDLNEHQKDLIHILTTISDNYDGVISREILETFEMLSGRVYDVEQMMTGCSFFKKEHPDVFVVKFVPEKVNPKKITKKDIESAKNKNFYKETLFYLFSYYLESQYIFGSEEMDAITNLPIYTQVFNEKEKIRDIAEDLLFDLCGVLKTPFKLTHADLMKTLRIMEKKYIKKDDDLRIPEFVNLEQKIKDNIDIYLPAFQNLLDKMDKLMTAMMIKNIEIACSQIMKDNIGILN